jgi:hypothetical protein
VDEADVPDDLPNLGLSGELSVAWQQAKDWAVDELMSDLCGSVAANVRELRELENFAHFENAVYTHWLRVLYPAVGEDRKPWVSQPRREKDGKPHKSPDPDLRRRWPPGQCWLRGDDDPRLTTRLGGREYPTRIAGLMGARREQEYQLRVLGGAEEVWTPAKKTVAKLREPRDEATSVKLGGEDGALYDEHGIKLPLVRQPAGAAVRYWKTSHDRRFAEWVADQAMARTPADRTDISRQLGARDAQPVDAADAEAGAPEDDETA